MTIPFITLAEAKEALRTPTQNTNDAKITALIVEASSVIEQYCRREFDKKERTEFFNTKNTMDVRADLYGQSSTGYVGVGSYQTYSLRVQNIDEAAPFSVYLDYSRVHGESTKLAASDYIIDHANGTLKLFGRTFEAMNAVKVVYTAGYAKSAAPETLSESLPATLKLACKVQLCFLWDRFQSQSFGVHQQIEEKGRMYSNKGLIPPEVMEMCNPFRRYIVR